MYNLRFQILREYIRFACTITRDYIKFTCRITIKDLVVKIQEHTRFCIPMTKRLHKFSSLVPLVPKRAY